MNISDIESLYQLVVGTIIARFDLVADIFDKMFSGFFKPDYDGLGFENSNPFFTLLTSLAFFLCCLKEAKEKPDIPLLTNTTITAAIKIVLAIAKETERASSHGYSSSSFNMVSALKVSVTKAEAQTLNGTLFEPSTQLQHLF